MTAAVAAELQTLSISPAPAADQEVRNFRRFVISRRPLRPEVVGCHWFRRNLRVYDNPSLLHAFAPPVTTVFAFYILGDDFPDG
jgi:hypothetical protein